MLALMQALNQNYRVPEPSSCLERMLAVDSA